MEKTAMGNTDHLVVTIGRSFGAGGREVGHRIAARLGISYYDKELLTEAARSCGLDAGLFLRNDERAPSAFSGLLPMSAAYGMMSWVGGVGSSEVGHGAGEAVYRAQSEFIRRVASRGPCVVVGRTADYVLRDFPRLVSVFLHAPERVCVERIMHRTDGVSAEEAARMLRTTNRLRARFYNYYTGRKWGDALGYDLCVDSSLISIDDVVDIICDYIARRFKSRL